MHALEQLATAGFRGPDQADLEAQSPGLGDIFGDDMADTACGDRIEIKCGAKGEAGQDRQLMRRINAIDIESWVCFGISQSLGIGEHIGKVTAMGLHFREDIVAGAVEDSIDRGDGIGGGPFAQALDDRNAASDCRFIFERNARLLGSLGELHAVMRDHRLIGCDKGFSGANRIAGEAQRGAVRATNQFGNHVNIVTGGEGGRIVFPGQARQVHAAIAAAIARRHRRHFNSPTGTPFNQRAILFEQLDNACTHRSEARQRHAQCIAHIIRPLTHAGPALIVSRFKCYRAKYED